MKVWKSKTRFSSLEERVFLCPFPFGEGIDYGKDDAIPEQLAISRLGRGPAKAWKSPLAPLCQRGVGGI
jgi:hypothetical protein